MPIIDKLTISNSIEFAYNLLKDLGYEKTILIDDVDAKTRARTTLTTIGLQLDKDTMRIDQKTEIQIQNQPVVYIKTSNLMDGTEYLIPKMNQRYVKKEVIDFDFTVVGEEKIMIGQPYLTQSIKKIFNLWIIRLKV